MDHGSVFRALEAVCEESISAISAQLSLLQHDATGPLLATMKRIKEHGQAVSALVSGFTAVYHHFDFNTETPANGYRTLVKFCPSLRPFLQTVVISMVSFGENYKKQQTGLGRAALSVITSGKYMVDPELRGAEFERITQNLDMHFWKTFWNITETELISSLARIRSEAVQVNLTLTIPGEPLSLPLAADPSLSVTVSPPIAHWGPGPVQVRLISYMLRQGQDSPELFSFSRFKASPVRPQTGPLSPWLLIHFHGGGFVAQTSKSHESYLKSWSKDLNVPILSVDYSLAPEAPFPRALEECFYAYCWALKNCQLLGSTAERVCLAGDSAGGNLCITVSMKAMSHGVRVPDGIMAAYPATLLTADASPSRFLTLIDPVLPLSVLYKCVNAYTGMDTVTVQPRQELDSLTALGRDTALLFESITQGASSWLQALLDRTPSSPAESSGRHQNAVPHMSASVLQGSREFPEGFEPLRSGCLAEIYTPCMPIMKNPFVSPLLAPDDLLKRLPPVHLVASGLDALLDDSVMFAKKLKSIDQPVTLTVVEDIPHGFLSLSQLCKETKDASDICVARIKDVFERNTPQ
ncbi:Hormone-sensitive lipase [Bagarius yarrelli]|uniref:Hormone-sensitive lipase n=1 Tax=Bagarius yarrelli TaxID=175774 RepID=A0A556U8M2_BAGYA|nr:Hormone-sensitive lipase [Bagarius yarrelli]